MSFDTSLQDLIDQIPVAMQVFARGVEAFVQDSANKKRPMKLIPKLSCDSGLNDHSFFSLTTFVDPIKNCGRHAVCHLSRMKPYQMLVLPSAKCALEIFKLNLICVEQKGGAT